MPLDPQVQALLERVASGGQKPIDEIPIDEGRAVGRMLALFDGEPEPVAAVEDRRIPGPAGDIVVRVYRPTEEATALPAVAEPVIEAPAGCETTSRGHVTWTLSLRLVSRYP